MIAQTNARELLQRNLDRTEMLIVAMEKIKALNRLYQMKQTDPEYYRMVRAIQDAELAKIEQSCGEHAVISLVTAFETYYKEMAQQLSAQYPHHFVTRHTTYSDKLNNLIHSEDVFTYEDIESELKLRNRFEYYGFFSAYSIPFLLGSVDTSLCTWE